MMKENQLQVYHNGLWMKTSEENLLKWKETLMHILKFYGYKLLLSMPLKDSYHLSFKKGSEPLMVNCFHDGNIQMATVEVPKMMELIIPHLERKLKIKLDFPADVKFIGTPYFADFLRARGMLKAPRLVKDDINATSEVVKKRRSSEDLHLYNSDEDTTELFKELRRRKISEDPKLFLKTTEEHPEETETKCRRKTEGSKVIVVKRKGKGKGNEELWCNQEAKVFEVAKAINTFDRVTFNNSVLRLHDELGDARCRLTKTEGDLVHIRKELGHLSKDVKELKQKNRKYLKENLTHDQKYWQGYQQYLDAKKELMSKKTKKSEAKVGWKI